jgi:hypothetical protein
MRMNGFMIAALCLSFLIVLLSSTLGANPYSRMIFYPGLEALTIGGVLILLQLCRRNILTALIVYASALPITIVVCAYIIYTQNIYWNLDEVRFHFLHEGWKPFFLALPGSVLTWLFLRSGSKSKLLDREYYLFRSEFKREVD